MKTSDKQSKIGHLESLQRASDSGFDAGVGACLDQIELARLRPNTRRTIKEVLRSARRRLGLTKILSLAVARAIGAGNSFCDTLTKVMGVKQSSKRPKHYGVEHEIAHHRLSFIEGDDTVETFERRISSPLLREDEWNCRGSL
jgi:hypothetical protein